MIKKRLFSFRQIFVLFSFYQKQQKVKNDFKEKMVFKLV